MESPVLAYIQGIRPNPPLMSQNLAQNSIIHIDPNTGRDSETSTGSETGPYRSITYTLQRVQSGTVIQLNPGTYSQETGEVFPISLKDGVTLQGDEATNGQNTVIIGGGNFVSPTFARQNATIKTQGNSQIIGVTVTNPNTRGTGLWIESSSPVVSGCTFIESKRDGIFITSESNPKIQSNIFIQNAGNGISIARSGAGEIRNNVFQNTGFGISVNDDASPTIIENKIIENRDGIVISHQAKPILRNNLIENNERDGVVAISQAQPDLGTVDSPGQNIIRSNGRYDVYNATRGYTLTVVGNEIDQTRVSGAAEF
jgi:parallel beta-helix repeat protein